MFEAINDYVILEKVEPRTESGIVLSQGEESKILTYKVVATTDESKDLLEREIMAHKGMVSELGQGYYSTKIEDIRAVKVQ